MGVGLLRCRQAFIGLLSLSTQTSHRTDKGDSCARVDQGSAWYAVQVTVEVELVPATQAADVRERGKERLRMTHCVTLV